MTLYFGDHIFLIMIA